MLVRILVTRWNNIGSVLIIRIQRIRYFSRVLRNCVWEGILVIWTVSAFRYGWIGKAEPSHFDSASACRTPGGKKTERISLREKPRDPFAPSFLIQFSSLV